MTEVFLTPCTYCGLPASTKDHVIPVCVMFVSRKQASNKRDLVVPACRECNNIINAGGVGQWTIASRAAVVAGKLRKRNKKVLAMPNWSATEIGNLAPAMARWIEANMAHKREVEGRIDAAEAMSAEWDLVPSDVWARIEERKRMADGFSSLRDVLRNMPGPEA